MQKLSLLDFPGKLCCTIFTGGCNYACPYCHNAQLIPANLPVQISQGQALAFLQSRRGLLQGVCVSGGEPLLQDSLAEFLQQVKALGFLVKLDTNGSQPQKMRALVAQGLVDYVAMDIKAAPAGYGAACGKANVNMAAIQESLAFLLGGSTKYELRTTVLRSLHPMQDFIKIGQWLAGAKQYFLQSYLAPNGSRQEGLSAYSPQEMQQIKELLLPYVPTVQLRGI